MIVKTIKKRLPPEFVQPLAEMSEQMGFPYNFDKNLAEIRESFVQVTEQSLEMAKAIDGVDKETQQAKNRDDGHAVPLFIYRPARL